MLDAKASTSMPRSSLRHRADIDGLRAVAVLSVVAFHAFPEIIPGGFIGVDVFFVISGFLISSVILEGLERGTFSFTSFFARRIRRLVPSLLVVLITCLAVGWWILFPDEYAQLGKHVAAGAGFVSNLILWSEAGYFDASALTKPLLHLWSLGIEEQFYLAWPVVLWLAWRYAPRLLLSLTILLALASFHLSNIEGDQATAFYSPLNRFWELCAGSILALLLGRNDVQRPKFSTHHPTSWTAPFAANLSSGCGCALLAWGLWHINAHMLFPAPWALVPVLGTLLIIAAGPHAWINKIVLSRNLPVWFGLISFPLYLWHWPVLTLANIVSFVPLNNSIRIGLVLLSILFAWITYRFIEWPIRYGKTSRLRVSLLSGALLLTLITGYLTYTHSGWRGRIIGPQKAYVTQEARILEKRLLDTFQTYSAGGTGVFTKPVILIIGDSYIPAWSAALSTHIDQSRYDILSLSYLDCAITIEENRFRVGTKVAVREEACESVNRYFHQQAITRRIVAVLMVGHRPFEYQANQFRFDMIRWLQAGGAKFDFYIFGNYFQLDPSVHPSCEKLMQRARRDARVCLDSAVYPQADMFDRGQRYFPADLDFRFVDPIKLHCSYDRIGCLTEVEGVPFMYDWNHTNAVFLRGLFADILKRQKMELIRLGLLKYFKHQ